MQEVEVIILKSAISVLTGSFKALLRCHLTASKTPSLCG